MKVSKIFSVSWPYAAIITANIIWGINFLVAKLTLQEFPLMSLAFLRFFLAFILILPFLLVKKGSLDIKRGDLPMLSLAGILMVTLNIALFFAGLERTTVISASVLTLSVPVLSVLFGWAVLREKIYLYNLFGIILGVLGGAIVIGLPSFLLGMQQLSPQMFIGNILITFSSLAWVIGAIISKKMLQKYSTLTLTAFLFLTGMITFLLPAIVEQAQHPEWISKVTILGIFGLLYLAAASSVSAYFLFEWGLKKIGVIKADIFQYIQPVVAGTLGILVLNETLGITFTVGAILILISVYWSTWAKPEHKHHKAHRV